MSYQREDVVTEFPTILCIAEHPQVLHLRKATLESLGYGVKLASNDCAAIEVLEKTPVAAVVIEYEREGMDVEAVASYIKKRFPKLQIVLLSASSEMPEQILWLVDEYVMKSELAERLVPIIERACRCQQLSDQRSQRRRPAA